MATADLFQFALAVVFTTAGLASIAGHVLRPPPKDRLLLWTGLFALTYGVRMFVKDPLASALRVPYGPAVYVENALNYFIVLPALLFTEALYGQGWKRSLRLLLWIAGAYAVVGVVIDVLTRNPSAVPDPAGLVLAPGAVLVFIGGAIAGYRPPRFPESRVLLGGVAVFTAFVLHEHAVNANLISTPRNLEPVGYLMTVLCLAYIAGTRFFSNARQLAATEREMQSAREIQSSILPRSLPSVAGLTMAVRYVPLAAVAGDFYDVLAVANGCVAVLVADVSGHGVPAALIASMVKVAFTAEAGRTDDPGSILHGMNATLCGMFERAYVTAACVVLDRAAGQIRYALAGHPSPLLVGRDGAVQSLEERGMFIGMFPMATYATAVVDAPPGARLILYTDGITEASPAGSDTLFGAERLIACAIAERHRPTAEFADTLMTTVSAFARQHPLTHDDVTLVVVDFVAA